ncbi:hypothetical protein BS78_06G236400 [Paspalum vaginatum]|nr:hypothetical protein BS78_06G236400 [Paspalum vaginatum]
MGKPKQQVLSCFSPAPSSAASAQPKTLRRAPARRLLLPSQARARPLPLPKSPATKRPDPTPIAPSRDAVCRRLLEPLHPPRPLDPTTGGGKGSTPLEQQVVDLKARHPDVLLMVEVGYRFRFFGEAAAVLGIVTHSRTLTAASSLPASPRPLPRRRGTQGRGCAPDRDRGPEGRGRGRQAVRAGVLRGVHARHDRGRGRRARGWRRRARGGEQRVPRMRGG